MSTVVGIDLGGTKVAAAVLQDGSLSESHLLPTCLDDGDALVAQLVEIVGQARAEGPLDAVGVGVPSTIEFSTGRVVSSVNIPLADIPLRQVLGDALGVPVFVDNDATVAALAEAHDEELQLVARNLVMLTIGTGVGGGIVLGGRIFRGATGGAGELGHTLVAVKCDPDVPAGEDFPQVGSLESLAAGHALDRAARRIAGEDSDSTLGRKAASGQEVSGIDLVDAAQEGDAAAVAAVKRWAHLVGVGVANAINTFDPDEVVLGGGAARAGELLLNPAAEIAEGYIHPGLRGHARIRLARHGLRAGVLGAALLAEQELTGGSRLDGGAELSGHSGAPA
ncbi:MAG TPA: ROK family protein [Solirubrobacteraceae bacterium]|nr:ROK family protein [Solirubrobacteraceae bacterium]